MLDVATGFLYVFRRYYHVGYLDQCGVESSLFASDIYDNLVNGFTVLFVGTIVFLIILFVIGILALLLSGMAVEISKKDSVRKRFDWLRTKLLGKEESEIELPKFLIKYKNIVIKFLPIYFVLLVASYPFHKIMCWPSYLGRNQAVKEYELYSQSTAKGDQKSLFSKLQTYCIDGTQRNALLLATDRITYALYFPKTKTTAESVEIIAASRISCIKAGKNMAP